MKSEMNTNDDIVNCSLNVRGLAETVDRWATEWGYKTIFSSFSSQKVGVCLLFNNNFTFVLSKQYIEMVVS